MKTFNWIIPSKTVLIFTLAFIILGLGFSLWEHSFDPMFEYLKFPTMLGLFLFFFAKTDKDNY